MKLSELAVFLDAELDGDPDAECRGIRDPLEAGPHDLAFLDKGKRIDPGSLRAMALILDRRSDVSYPNRLLSENPRLAFCKALELFHPHQSFFPGISPQAFVDPSAKLEEGVSIGPFAVVGAMAEIGAGTEIHPHAVIYPGVKIGRNCLVYAGVIIREGTEAGDQVIFQPGAVVGADGFGYLVVDTGDLRKIPQVGTVQIGDFAELGANSCVDRGTLAATRVGTQVKLDNLVQVAHNVSLGSRTRLSAQTGISGSVDVGSDVVMGGQVGVADHISIAAGTMIAAQAGISGTIKDRAIYAGSPHQDIGSWRRSYVLLRNLDSYVERIKELEKRMEELINER